MERMSSSLRKTLKGLRALAADHRSGAAEIADRAAALLEDFLQQERAGDPRLPYALSALAETTLTIQPSMAPLLNLANRLQLAAEQNAAGLARARRELEAFRRQRGQSATRIAKLFAARLPKRRRATALTYSYSSTALAALLASSELIEQVILSEARPLYEGRTLAQRLAKGGIAVTLVIDAALPEQVAAADVVVVGADAVFDRAYVNKVGTGRLQEEAGRAGKPVLVLADTAKFLPRALAPFHCIEEKPGRELWRDPPEKVTVVNRYFEVIPFERQTTLLSERGVFTPTRVRAWVTKLPVARRWHEARPPGGP